MSCRFLLHSFPLVRNTRNWRNVVGFFPTFSHSPNLWNNYQHNLSSWQHRTTCWKLSCLFSLHLNPFLMHIKKCWHCSYLTWHQVINSPIRALQTFTVIKITEETHIQYFPSGLQTLYFCYSSAQKGRIFWTSLSLYLSPGGIKIRLCDVEEPSFT